MSLFPAFVSQGSCSTCSHPPRRLPNQNRIDSDNEINIKMEWINTSEKRTARVKKTNTIKEVKQFFIKSGISPSLTKLYFKGKMLENEYTLFFYGVEDDSIIMVETNVTSPYARLLHINLPKKSKSAKPVTVNIYASEADKIDTVKSMILLKEDTRIEPTGRYQMMKDGIQLRDSHTLAQNEVTNNATLSLVPVPKDSRIIRVTTCYNETYSMDVLGTNLIGNLRSTVAEMTQCEVEGSQLFKENIWLRDNRTLVSYNIKDNDTIYFKAKITIHVKRMWINAENNLVTVRVYPTDGATEVTTEVLRQSDLPISRFKPLKFNGNVLDATRPLMSYGIRIGSILTMGAAIDQ